MKHIFIALCILSTVVMVSCRKHYDEVTIPYNGTGYGDYTYTTQTDYYDKSGSLYKTIINTGTLFVFNTSSSTINLIPLYGWSYFLGLDNWDDTGGIFQLSTRDVYVNNKTLRITPTKQGKINANGSLDFGYESFDYGTSTKTVNTVHATLK